MFFKNILTNVQLYGFKQVDESFSFDNNSEDRQQQQLQVPDLSENVNFQVQGKITQVALGQSHGLLLNELEKVQTVGSNQFGQRGDQAVNAFTPSTLDLNGQLQINILSVQQVACGLYHSVCLDKEKNVYAWGRGTEGQLGLGDIDFQHEPVKVILPPVSYISCGGSHTLFITQEGEVYACGDNTWGQLGVGSTQTIKQKPIRIDFGDVKIVSVQGGLEHSIFLTTDGNVYASGNNLFSQCGLEGTSNLIKPTFVSIPLQTNEFVTNIYASMGTFSAVLTSRSNIYVWGTGSWGHARKPTNIQEICSFDGIPKFSNLLMGDNYALIQDIKGFLVFGSNQLPDLASQQPIQKFKCQPIRLGSFIKVILGCKMLLVLEKEVCSNSSDQTNKIEILSQKNNQRPPSAQSIRSNHSTHVVPKIVEDARTKALLLAQAEIADLKKELDLCKQSMKQKDELIVQLKDNLSKHEKENNKLLNTLKAMEQTPKNASKTSSKIISKMPSKEVSPKPSPKVETKFINDIGDIRRPSIYNTSKMEEHNLNSYNQPSTMSPYLYGCGTNETNKRPFQATDKKEFDNNCRKQSLPPTSQPVDSKTVTQKATVPLHSSNKSWSSNSFQYKTYERLRLMSACSPSIQEEQEEVETRIKKIDEGQFSLSRYNMKSIRSITPYDLRSQNHFDSSSSVVTDIRQSAVENITDVDAILPLKLNDQPSRAITPECLPQVPEYYRTRFNTQANQRENYNPIPEKFINTSIIDKICNYQRIMGVCNDRYQKPLLQNQNDKLANSVKVNQTEQRLKHSPYEVRSSYPNCDFSYVDQFSSICQDLEKNCKQDDYFRLRG